MARDDIFRIIYVILKELYEAQKAGKRIDPDDVSSERFQIPPGYLAENSQVTELIDRGYVRGVSYRENGKPGRISTPLEDMSITLEGVEYLQSNSMMKKVHELLKDVKDIIPGI